MTATIPATSVEYLHIPVTGALSSMPVEIAVVPAEPADADWRTAAWDTTGPTLDAKVLIGPGTPLELPAGVYSAWVRVTATPETPVLRAGLVRIV